MIESSHSNGTSTPRHVQRQLRLDLGGMACEEEEPKAAPQPRVAASGRLLTFAYEYASHPQWERLETRDACEETIRLAFDGIGFHTSPKYPVGPAGMKETVKGAAAALNPGDVLAVYYFGHGLAHADNQYLATEDGLVCARCLRNIVIEAVAENDVPHVTFLLLLDCCRNEDATCDWASALNAHRATHPTCRDDYAITDATRLGITVSYSTCPGT